jgi:predicted nucleotide-binding protein (sugar kinase/HSP70/actin superfamily)
MERYLANLYRKNPIERFAVNLKTSYMFSRIRGFEEELSGYLADRYEPPMERILDSGRRFLPLIFEGEAILTAARALAFLEDGAAMVVNAAPFGCMPGNITHALFHRVQREQGKPILTLFYDGESDVNRSVGVYLKNLRNAAGEGPERTMALGISGDTAKEECETA